LTAAGEQYVDPRLSLEEAHQRLDPIGSRAREVEQHGLQLTRDDDVRGVGALFEAARDQGVHDVDTLGIARKSVIGRDDDVGPVSQTERVDSSERPREARVDLVKHAQCLRRSDAIDVLGRVERSHPVDDDIGFELRQDIFAKDVVGPLHLAQIVGIRRRQAEPLDDGVARLLRITGNDAAVEQTVDSHAGAASPRGGVEQEAVAGRRGTHRDEPLAISKQHFAERVRRHRAPAAVFELQQLRVVARVEWRAFVHRRGEHAVADDPMEQRVRACGERGGVQTRHRRKRGMAVDVLRTLALKPRQSRRIAIVDAVGPQTVHDEDRDEPLRRVLRLAGGDSQGTANEQSLQCARHARKDTPLSVSREP
jgi:hypothetical protein